VCFVPIAHVARPTASFSQPQGSCPNERRPTGPRNNVFPPIKKSGRLGIPHATATTRPAEVSPQPNPAELFERRVIIVFPPHADGPAFGFSKWGINTKTVGQWGAWESTRVPGLLGFNESIPVSVGQQHPRYSWWRLRNPAVPARWRQGPVGLPWPWDKLVVVVSSWLR
jgi:hypothetical protein